LPTWTSVEMPAKHRLDAELVRRGLARSRQHAQELVSAGRVRVGGIVATKAATGVDAESSVRVDGPPTGNLDYVSRGGHKLAGALDALGGPSVSGRRCLDAGASTGGFTDVLLQRGAREVVAVDVGYGQLAWRLRTDPRVAVHERTNVRTLEPDVIGGPTELTVADLSFISLSLVIPALARCTVADGDMALMVKPQFEAGRGQVAGGVVRDPGVRAAAVRSVADTAAELGWGCRSVVASQLPGPAGNVEFFLWLRRDAGELVPGAIDRAITDGPV
jgi:23S rRNA (cytidine1920-2'-O)/16S rRNA (cytidine1409-2'-O)-methyltransferase